MSPTLRALLRYTKSENRPRRDEHSTWERVRTLVLGPLYYENMGLLDVVRVVLSAWTEALVEPRFEMPSRHNAAEDLVLAPVTGFHSVELLGARELDKAYSVKQFYDAMLRKMLSDLMLARVDWCRGEVWPERVENPAQALSDGTDSTNTPALAG